MGTVYADITLKNSGDVIKARDGIIRDDEIRGTAVRALVDTGAGTLVISEEVREKLGVRICGLREATLANDKKEICKVTEPLDVIWKNRDCTCRALVCSGWGEILLGAIPLEDMDLIVDPVRQELTGAHGDEALALLK